MDSLFPSSFEVCVHCMVYNHARFILDALAGFTKQKTSFDYVTVIVDDASTDRSGEILLDFYNDCFLTDEEGVAWHKEDDYARYYFARCKDNPHCFFAIQLLKTNRYRQQIKRDKIKEWSERSRYVALCEGDDYWIDSLKLQKQVDFLNSNPEYSLCFGNAIEHWEGKNLDDKIFSRIEDRDYDPDETSQGWIVPTATSLFRKEVYETQLYQRYVQDSKIITGDLPLWLTLSTIGLLRGFSDVFSVYRRLDSGFMLKMKSKDRIAMGDHRVEIYKVFGSHYKKSTISMAMTHYRLALVYAKMEKDPKMLLKSLWKFISVRLMYPGVFLYHVQKIFEEKRLARSKN